MELCVITIAREFGSGGRLIGEQLARELGIPFYDKEIISLTAKQSGFAETVVKETQHKKTTSFLYGLYMTSQELPVTDQVFIAQSQVIQEVAAQGPCVIVGRCGDYALRERQNCRHVFVHAPMEERIRRVREEYGSREENLEGHIRKEDRKRASYYNHFTQKKWGAAHNYDLCINSAIGIDTSVRIIKEIVGGNR